MIFGIGAGIVETTTLGDIAAGGRQYLESIFTSREIEYCESKARKLEHYAARYAAKQATLKALGLPWRQDVALSEIEVVADQHGTPQLRVHREVQSLFTENQIRQASLSLSHTGSSAIAVIILED